MWRKVFLDKKYIKFVRKAPEYKLSKSSKSAGKLKKTIFPHLTIYLSNG